MRMPAQVMGMGIPAAPCPVCARVAKIAGWLGCRLQAMSGLDTANANEPTGASTLRLQEIAQDEARVQGAILVTLMCELWEPLQTVSNSEPPADESK